MNVSSLKTPGVYINEIDAFPPSVAQVATAIPAFIGYTEKGPLVPTRISSFMEFEQFFGGAPKPASVSVELDANLLPTDNSTVTESKFKLYNSLRLFYGNGGGVCYIVSVGNYTASISKGDFYADGDTTVGLGKLTKFDEPTLLLFPDAINLSATDLGLIQQQALLQCADLMDRFTIMDVKQELGLIADSEKFRDSVGNQNLKYGSSYYPYLKSAFPYTYKFNDINGTGAGKVNFASIYSSNATIKGSLEKFSAVSSAINDYSADYLALDKDKVVLLNDFSNTDEYYEKLWDMLAVLGKPSDLADPLEAQLKAYLENNIKVSLKQYAQRLVDFKVEYDTIETPLAYGPAPDFDVAIWGPFTATLPNNLYDGLLDTSGSSDLSKIQLALDKLQLQILNAMTAAIASLESYATAEENNLISSIPIYAAIVTKLSQAMNTVPPSGAIAGIYAQTDATRGVWKSPANISVNGIIGLTDDINDAEQEDMNIHETGKSINAIRKFTGKGFMVWGGRTLAGNSNDWRYVNVRRLANMIEESVKKAAMQFVFEPNVALTWVSVKGMIDNYLTTLWKDGALAGAKPEHAFFVSVGLNETMSAQDILEGRMIVKIGYAPSRPTEFIVLEFKQMQQKS